MRRWPGTLASVKVGGATGYLAMEIPRVYGIKSDNHAVKAILSADGAVSSVDLIKDKWSDG